MKFIPINLSKQAHCEALIKLLNHYMLDPMGGGKAMTNDHPDKVLKGLKNQCNYAGFFITHQEKYIALANCFIGYSTFKAKQLINIHDFIVHTDFRNMGVGFMLLNGISGYAKSKNMCRVNLEVREDNLKAMSLYKKAGFTTCDPNMFFWQKSV